jgi:hypothetical protein
MISATDQQIMKIELSDSFRSDRTSEIELSPQEVSQMVDSLHSALIMSKVLSRESPKPEPTLLNLSYLINTVCDEFLLEIDQPMMKTHFSPELQMKILQENPVEIVNEELETEELLNRLLFADRDIILTEKNCKELSALIIELSKNSSTSELKAHKQKLEEKLICYGEELIKHKRVLKDKEKEVQKLQKQLIHLKEEREFYVNPIYPPSISHTDTPGLSECTDY